MVGRHSAAAVSGEGARGQRRRPASIVVLDEPEAIPRGTDDACVLNPDVPVIVRHARLDSRQP
jgi:hypothetical protein